MTTTNAKNLFFYYSSITLLNFKIKLQSPSPTLYTGQARQPFRERFGPCRPHYQKSHSNFGPGVLLGGETGRRRSVQYLVESPSNTFQWSSDTYIDLLEPVQSTTTQEESSSSRLTEVVRRVVPYILLFLRAPLASFLCATCLRARPYPLPMSEDYHRKR
jgi:hypothetical protein